ncbi:hypothetical protein JJE66_33710 [Bradyrhizobium diazoefficiens]|uniref:hypothetical protein n=1 Tax=Bradyrhizobium diazoefficiens TaxID=1355477 RepID=UPI00190AAF18|nr:hypothetical protein [Bradyrhizobium diazoefficiens]MBK3666165.1 hypothetical protein [Bradyrhizobium diazoefficiens]
MTKEITIREGGYELTQPRQMVDLATVLKKHIVDNRLYTTITGKNYAHVEGWQFAGGMLGMFPRVTGVENLSTDHETKWKADVEVVDLRTGAIISRGFAICSNKESKKKTFDEYAVLSMAQTRAIGKAYRNVIGWVMKLAGYEPTASEEMTRAGETAAAAQPEGKSDKSAEQVVEHVCHGLTKSGCGEELTEQEFDYSKKMYGKPLCRKHQKEAKPLKK